MFFFLCYVFDAPLATLSHTLLIFLHFIKTRQSLHATNVVPMRPDNVPKSKRQNDDVPRKRNDDAYSMMPKWKRKQNLVWFGIGRRGNMNISMIPPKNHGGIDVHIVS